MVAAVRNSSPRTLALVVVALGLVAALVVAGARAAVSAAPPPEIGADELLASVADAAADPPPISGEVAATVELGLPELPAGTAGEGDGLAELAGDQRLRVWRSEDGVRVAQLGDTSERAFISDGEQVWRWDSRTLEVERLVLPEGDGDGKALGQESQDLPPGADPALEARDPLAVAGAALAALDESTEVRVDRAASVAGRDTYRLVLEPRTDETLVGRVELDVDAAQRIPLRAAVYARDAAAPSIEAAFTSVSFDPIDPATFAFTPPPGAQVTEVQPEDLRGHGDGAPAPSSGVTGADLPLDRRTFGEGWATVVAVPAPKGAPVEGEQGVEARALEGLLPYSGPLFSARLEIVEGQRWLLIGAVDQDALQAAAAALR